MKRILGLDLGTNSIGWGVIDLDFDKKEGNIIDAGSRIIPMSQDVLGKFGSGQSHSQTADRTGYRGIRRLYQRDNLRRERLHRVLNLIGFLPEHYSNAIDFEKRLGQFKKGQEPKINFKKSTGIKPKYEFLFKNSFSEMAEEFKRANYLGPIPYDWTIYYLRKKALSQRIEKEELAWLLLNFNQKRGYYQQRGEEEETDPNKTKTYEVLSVKDIIDTGETLKDKKTKLFKVIFTNGWEYDKPIAKTENWIDSTHEFIVTTTKTKNGDLKRTFKSVDSEIDWPAIKAKTEQNIDQSGLTIGAYIFNNLLANPKLKIRGGLIKTIERKYYKKELRVILEEQAKHHPEFSNQSTYINCIKELYPRNEAHQNNLKDKNLEHLLLDDIIFYQRPLKSQKHNIANCQFEKRSFTNPETGEEWQKPLKGISKSHPLFQEFRIWQFISNLRFYDKSIISNGQEKEITTEVLSSEELVEELYEWLAKRKEVDQQQLLKFLSDKKLISKQQKGESTIRWNYPEDKKYPMGEFRAQILGKLKKVDGCTPEYFYAGTNEIELWHIIYSVSDKKEYEKALATFAKKRGIDVKSFLEAFKNFPPFKSDFGAFSEKAIRKILPLMRLGKYWNEDNIHPQTLERIDKILTGEFDDKINNRVRELAINLNELKDFKGLPVWLASYIIYDRHSESANKTLWKSPKDIDQYLYEFKQHSLKNPIVEQVLSETLRVVRDIWHTYGNKERKRPFDEIHIELGREMKNPANKRKQIAQNVLSNENTNNRIKEILHELKNEGIEVRPYSPSHQEILKIYEEGIYQSAEPNDEIDKIRRSNNPNQSEITRYKLWLEQGYISPYTGKIIPLSDLFSSNYQIEHIIPQSRYFDDSIGNKVICESAVNSLKDNKTGLEFILAHGTQKVDLGGGKTVNILSENEYKSHCEKYFKKNRVKLKNLLSEDVPESFINRQLNDSRYISKLVKNLLSHIVREEEEQEATSKNIVTVSGAITSKLKQDWGLNDKWNDLIAYRFKRLNEITNSEDYGYWDNKINSFRLTVPKSISKGFSKKRIDHRHHALDAIVIAACTKDHINYITSLNTERKNYSLVDKLRYTQQKVINGKERTIAKGFKIPWNDFQNEVKNTLEVIIPSFKQNLRVINKTTNKTWQWVEANGQLKKQLVPQTKGDSWAIRKPLHAPLPYGKNLYSFRVLELSKNIGKKDFIIDKSVREKVNDLYELNERNISATQIFVKSNPILDEFGKGIKYAAFAIEEERYRKRQPISKLANRGPGGIKKYEDAIKLINKVSDLQLQLDLLKHLEDNHQDIDIAFSIEGINNFNKKRKTPVYKLPISEASTSKFDIGDSLNCKVKYGEAESGTNLFFAIYWDEKKKKRVYETVPLNEVIAHQKQVAHLPKHERTPVPVKAELGNFLFTLSPNDLVYVPNENEISNPNLVDFENLSAEQNSRIYKMVSTTQNKLDCVPASYAKEIIKNELGSNNKNQNSIGGIQIKSVCWKLTVNRLGELKRSVSC